MSVCACGGMMEIGAGWCQRCWAIWSTWYLRAGGVWILLPNGPRCLAPGATCGCIGCSAQRSMLVERDEAENIALSKFKR